MPRSAALSESQERTIGNRVMREVRNDPHVPRRRRRSPTYVKALGARLLAVAEGPRRDLEFFVINDEQINAFALVGGHIGINTGLIALTQNESELAGVMAHEISHITQRHQARSMHGQRGAQIVSLAALALAVLASRGGGSQAGQVTEAAVDGRQRARDADRSSTTRATTSARPTAWASPLLERAGLDTRGMVTFFERLLRANRLNEFKGAPSYLRTHPLTTERIADMQDRVERMPTRMVPDSFEYRLARAKIRAMAGLAAGSGATTSRTQLADKTVLRPREDVYGLAYAQRRARDLDARLEDARPRCARAWSRIPPSSCSPRSSTPTRAASTTRSPSIARR